MARAALKAELAETQAEVEARDKMLIWASGTDNTGKYVDAIKREMYLKKQLAALGPEDTVTPHDEAKKPVVTPPSESTKNTERPIVTPPKSPTHDYHCPSPKEDDQLAKMWHDLLIVDDEVAIIMADVSQADEEDFKQLLYHQVMLQHMLAQYHAKKTFALFKRRK